MDFRLEIRFWYLDKTASSEFTVWVAVLQRISKNYIKVWKPVKYNFMIDSVTLYDVTLEFSFHRPDRNTLRFDLAS